MTSANHRIRAVLWDFGGVITTSPFEAFNRYEAANNLPRNFIRTVNATNAEHNAWALFESSRISAAEFNVAFASEARRAGHEIAGDVVIGLLSGDIRPRMVEALKLCKRDYRIACLTNNVKAGEGPGMARDPAKAQRVREVMSLFDLVIESSKEGVRKPNPQFYALACERLGVKPHECVFLDDLGVNLKSAQALGMQTIKVIDETQALDDLGKILNLKFDD